MDTFPQLSIQFFFFEPAFITVSVHGQNFLMYNLKWIVFSLLVKVVLELYTKEYGETNL